MGEEGSGPGSAGERWEGKRPRKAEWAKAGREQSSCSPGGFWGPHTREFPQFCSQQDLGLSWLWEGAFPCPTAPGLEHREKMWIMCPSQALESTRAYFRAESLYFCPSKLIFLGSEATTSSQDLGFTSPGAPTWGNDERQENNPCFSMRNVLTQLFWQHHDPRERKTLPEIPGSKLLWESLMGKVF